MFLILSRSFINLGNLFHLGFGECFMFGLIFGACYLRNKAGVYNKLTTDKPVKRAKDVFFITNGECKRRLNGHMLGFNVRDKVIFGVAGVLDFAILVGVITYFI